MKIILGFELIIYVFTNFYKVIKPAKTGKIPSIYIKYL